MAERRVAPFGNLVACIGEREEWSVAGSDGQTYFVEVKFEELSSGAGVRIKATVDLGNSYKLERIEESIEITVS